MHQRFSTWLPPLAASIVLLLLFATPASAVDEGVSGSAPSATESTSASIDRPVAPPELKSLPKRAADTTTKLIPLPIYSTLPNEGSTWGFMPVFFTVEDKTQFTRSIIAPSVSWNKTIRFTTTFRGYYYPSAIESLTFIPSISSNVNRGVTLEYLRHPTAPGELMLDLGAHFRRSIFFRFFGIGPESKSANESSYTRLGGDAGGRIGYTITKYFSAGLKLLFQRDLLERIHVDYLPLTHDRFPDAPGLGGAASLFEGLSLRYDTRPVREYSTRGFMTDITAGVSQGLSGIENNFGRLSFESRLLWEEFSWLNGAARVYWSYVPGSNLPFYQQSSLGGSFRLRGFNEDRWIDKGAWELELEQRLVLFQTHIYGVTSDWRIDPFVAIGQVYHGVSDMFRHTQVTGGLGFRAFVRPNVLGRVDTAYGADGLKIYVELGYPF